MVLLLVWIPSLLTLLHLMIIQVHGIEAGWNCETGGCGLSGKSFEDIGRVWDSLDELGRVWKLLGKFWG